MSLCPKKEISPDSFAALVRLHRGAIAEKLETLQRWQARYAGWEPVYPDVCKITMQALLNLQEAMQQLVAHLREYRWPIGLERLSALPYVRRLLFAAHERGDEAAIAVRSYQPVSDSVEEVALRQLKNARQQLAKFVEMVQDVLKRITVLFPESGTTVTEEGPLLLPAPTGLTVVKGEAKQ